MNKIFLLVSFLSLRVILSSQSSTMPVIFVAGTSKVTYTDQVKTMIIPGSIINKSGQITASPNGRLLMYPDFSFVSFDASNMAMEVAKLFEDQDGLISEEESKFGEYISDAVYNAVSSGIVMKNQKLLLSGWGAKGSSGRDG
ncbi:MAG TPA: hypothetical protein PKD85_07140, partial [Saprospiraceae bacterium]|nr:hypothetical protein [Saprospiraceae bacterium]